MENHKRGAVPRNQAALASGRAGFKCEGPKPNARWPAYNAQRKHFHRPKPCPITSAGLPRVALIDRTEHRLAGCQNYLISTSLTVDTRELSIFCRLRLSPVHALTNGRGSTLTRGWMVRQLQCRSPTRSCSYRAGSGTSFAGEKPKCQSAKVLKVPKC